MTTFLFGCLYAYNPSFKDTQPQIQFSQSDEKRFEQSRLELKKMPNGSIYDY